MNTTTIRRQRPQKPERSVEIAKDATSAEAINFLNEFMKEARKEIRRRETIAMKGKVSKTDCDIVTFLGESFSLTINFKEGIRI
jgi:hypothetical protein